MSWTARLPCLGQLRSFKGVLQGLSSLLLCLQKGKAWAGGKIQCWEIWRGDYGSFILCCRQLATQWNVAHPMLHICQIGTKSENKGATKQANKLQAVNLYLCVVATFLSWTLCVKGLHVWPFFFFFFNIILWPCHLGSHTHVFIGCIFISGRWMLLMSCKELLMAENSPHITMQCMTTL